MITGNSTGKIVVKLLCKLATVACTMFNESVAFILFLHFYFFVAVTTIRLYYSPHRMSQESGNGSDQERDRKDAHEHIEDVEVYKKVHVI